MIRLLDGSRAYLHAVIDDFSRRILGWKVTPTFDPAATAEILLAAAKGLEHGTHPLRCQQVVLDRRPRPCDLMQHDRQVVMRKVLRGLADDPLQ